MSTSQKRDAGMDRLLRAVLKPAPRQADETGFEAGTGCPDAGVLAAFVEGGLTATEQLALETHLAGCGRCQEALSVISEHLPGEPVAEAAAPETRWFTWVTQPRLRWFVPIGAAATVAVVFFATRPLIAPEGGDILLSEAVQMAQAPAPPAELPGAGDEALREEPAQRLEKRESAGAARPFDAAKSQDVQAPRPGDARGMLADAAPAGRVELEKQPAEPVAGMMAARVASEEKRRQPAAPAPPSAAVQMVAAAPPAGKAAGAPAAAGAGRTQAAAELDRPAGVAGDSARFVRDPEAGPVTVVAPGGTVRWIVGAGGRLERSLDAGASWQPQVSGTKADLQAGAAPSPSVCWVVGSAGTVLLTSDGELWRRLPFPLAVDLVVVQAADARAATVTTRDGRRFETLDAGLSWSPKQQ